MSHSLLSLLHCHLWPLFLQGRSVQFVNPQAPQAARVSWGPLVDWFVGAKPHVICGQVIVTSAESAGKGGV